MNAPRYIRPELLEAIARNTLKRFDPRLIDSMENLCVPIEEIIEGLGLTIPVYGLPPRVWSLL